MKRRIGQINLCKNLYAKAHFSFWKKPWRAQKERKHLMQLKHDKFHAFQRLQSEELIIQNDYIWSLMKKIHVVMLKRLI